MKNSKQNECEESNTARNPIWKKGVGFSQRSPYKNEDKRDENNSILKTEEYYNIKIINVIEFINYIEIFHYTFNNNKSR